MANDLYNGVNILGGTFASSVQFTSSVATGTPPLVVTSTTPVANLSIGGTSSYTNYQYSLDLISRVANNVIPTTSAKVVRYDFVSGASAGAPGSLYAGLMTYSPWFGTTATGGAQSYQISYGSNIQNTGTIPVLSIRNGIDATWNAWYKIVHTGNIATYIDQYANAAGTSDAITATYPTAMPTLGDGYKLGIDITTPNTTTTPTFTPTIGGVAQSTASIVKFFGGAAIPLAVGDLQGVVELRYDLTNTRWVLQNPAPSIRTAGTSGAIQLNGVDVVPFNTGGMPNKLISITAAVAANAMTLTLKPCVLDFRSTTLTNGVATTLRVDTDISVTIPSGKTLGTMSGIPSKIAVLAINSLGTVVLAVTNLYGKVLDETGLIDVITLTGTPDNVTYVYAAASITGVPYRVVGIIDSTQTTAGTWAAAPTLVTPAGGNSLSTTSGFGAGQKWVTPAGANTAATYYNTTGKVIMVRCTMTVTAAGYASIVVTVDGVQLPTRYSYETLASSTIETSFLVGPGSNYAVSGVNCTYGTWMEFR